MGAFVQSKPTVVSASSITLNLGLAPTTGNLLFVTLTHCLDPGAYTPPSDWTQIGSTFNNGDCYQSDWYKKNVDTTNSFQWTYANSRVTVGVLQEYSGLDQTTPLESSQTNTGTSTTPTTANITTTNANDFLVAAYGQADGLTLGGSDAFSAPTNSFTHLDSADSTQIDLFQVLAAGGAASRTLTATGTYNTAVTSAQNKTWTSRIVAFVDATATTKQSSDGAAATGSEGYTVSLVVEQSDTGIGTVGYTLTGLMFVAESGLGVESFNGGALLAIWQRDDTGRGTEGYFIIVALTRSDTGVESEFYHSGVILCAFDSANCVEYYSVFATLQNFQTGMEVESFGASIVSQATDSTGHGTEFWSTSAYTSNFDTTQATGADCYALLGILFRLDTGAGSELNSLMAQTYSSEVGTGREAQKADANISPGTPNETGVGREGYSLNIIVPSNKIQITGTTELPITIQGTIE